MTKGKNNSGSQINISEMERFINDITNTSVEDKYNDFNIHISSLNLSTLKYEELDKLYSDGKALLDEYYLITEGKDNSNILKCDKKIIMQIHYSMNQLSYYLNKIIKENLDKNYKAQNIKISSFNATLNKTKHSLKDIDRKLNTIITTVISVILTISIITSAVVGIENINSNYILPFVSTLVLFGMIMTIFTYSLYKKYLKKESIIIIIVTIILTIFLWILSWKVNISNIFNNSNYTKNSRNVLAAIYIT